MLKKISAALIHLNILDGDVPIVLTNDIDDACKFSDNNSLYQDLIKLEGLKVTEVVVKKSIVIETSHHKKEDVKYES